jgi:ferredoxin
MKEKGPGLLKEGKAYADGKSLLGDYITPEELWACTTCNACAQECPLNINHPTLIVDMRRYLVMEEAAAPSGLNMMFTNIENNGAPWQFSPQDRLKWAEGLSMNLTRFTWKRSGERRWWISLSWRKWLLPEGNLNGCSGLDVQVLSMSGTRSDTLLRENPGPLRRGFRRTWPRGDLYRRSRQKSR